MDIVERLRSLIGGYNGDADIDDRLEEAAHEIEKLRWENANMEKLWGKSEGTWMEIRDKQDAEIERLRAALKEIVESARLVGDWLHVRIARDALKEKE